VLQLKYKMKLKQLIFIPFFITLIGCVSSIAIGQNTMNSEKKCANTSVQRSQVMLRAILDDLTTSYTELGGGGISQIKLSATNTYVVSISQEERIDQITYEMSIDADCKVAIDKRTETSVTPY